MQLMAAVVPTLEAIEGRRIRSPQDNAVHRYFTVLALVQAVGISVALESSRGW